MLRVDLNSWQWAITRWSAYHASVFAPMLGLLATGAWFTAVWKKRQRASGESDPVMQGRGFRHGLLQCLARSAMILATTALLAYLMIAPHVVEQLESEYVENLAVALPDGSYWTELEETRREVLADPEAMRRIKEAE